MKLVSWNVNGLRAAWNHGLSGFMQKFDADIYAFQETKVNEPFLLAEVEGYEAYWSFCDKRKGYSGTLVLTKTKPIDVVYDFCSCDEFNTEGRIITLEFDNFYFVNCYVPNSQSSERRKNYRAEWDGYLMRYLLNLKQHKSVIVCGDFNVPISDKDIYEESDWQEWNAEGFQSEERDNLLSQCWLHNGYEIKNLHLDKKKRVVFHMTNDSKNTSSVVLPEVLKYQCIPVEAKYELENYFQYIMRKYGL